MVSVKLRLAILYIFIFVPVVVVVFVLLMNVHVVKKENSDRGFTHVQYTHENQQRVRQKDFSTQE